MTSYHLYRLTTTSGDVVFFHARDIANAYDFASRYYQIAKLECCD